MCSFTLAVLFHYCFKLETGSIISVDVVVQAHSRNKLNQPKSI